MSKLTPENENLMRSYKNITKALSLSPKSREYFEFKRMMSEDEMTVLRFLKKELSQQNHLTNKTNGSVITNNRGRKKATKPDASVAEQTTTTTDAPVAEPTTDAPTTEQTTTNAPTTEQTTTNAPTTEQTTTTNETSDPLATVDQS
jgi:hypothetical protein